MTTVSVIVPCLNEEATITALLEALMAQSFPIEDMEVIVADGLSTDGTRQLIADYQATHASLSLRLIDNPSRKIPTGLNLAMDAAQNELILRLDAHSVPELNYIARCVDALEASRGWNVGGVWNIAPAVPGWVAASIASAAAHPFGAGDARYRLTPKEAQEVETVPFGAFQRSLINKIGPFDEALEANEDYEFNHRIHEAGGKVWLDPNIRSTYIARPTLGSLARQYARYGYWKWRMLRRYPGSLRWRQAVPPLFVLSLFFLSVLGIWLPAFWGLLKVEVVSYALLLLGAGVVKGLQMKNMWLIFGLPLAIAVMHLSWGSAFLWSVFRSGFREA